jgi:hypothetical protein
MARGESTRDNPSNFVTLDILGVLLLTVTTASPDYGLWPTDRVAWAILNRSTYLRARESVLYDTPLACLL